MGRPCRKGLSKENTKTVAPFLAQGNPHTRQPPPPLRAPSVALPCRTSAPPRCGWAQRFINEMKWATAVCVDMHSNRLDSFAGQASWVPEKKITKRKLPHDCCHWTGLTHSKSRDCGGVTDPGTTSMALVLKIIKKWACLEHFEGKSQNSFKISSTFFLYPT